VKHVRMTALAVLLLAAGTLAGCTGSPTQPPRGTPSGKTPVVFIHGYVLSPAMWNSFVAYLKTQGYTSGDIMNVGYQSSGVGAVDATRGAAQLAAAVDQILASTGKTKVNIVAHSLGNLMTKTCIVAGGCAGKVDHWANVAGAQNGTNIAYSCYDPACTDMRPGSALLRSLNGNGRAENAIRTQGIKEQVHWTQTDGIILPPTNSRETYAENIELKKAGLNHLNISDDRTVQADTVALFNR
jgi:triacylglycerol lipase